MLTARTKLRVKSVKVAALRDPGVMRAAIGGFEGAKRRRSHSEAWAVSSGSASADLLPDLATLRERSRDLDRNSPLAHGTVAGVVTNAIGAGLQCQPRIDRDYLGMSPETAAGWELEAWRIWDAWSEETDCDVAGVMHFNEMQDVVIRSALVSGDVFGVPRFVERDRIGFAVQLIEGDRVATPPAMAADKAVRGGIRFDPNGRPLSYYVANGHPGDARPGLLTYEAVPAFVGERAMMMHVFRPERPEQPRGIPYLAPVIDALKNLSTYSEAELHAAVVASFFTVFVKTDNPDGHAASLDTPPGKAPKLALGKGAVLDLAPSESIEIANPGRPNQAFDPFVMAVLRQIGVALELPFEVLIKHFTASYTAARAALLEAWKTYRSRRKWIVQRFCRPCRAAVIGEAVARGMLPAPGFFDDHLIRRAYLGDHWVGPSMGQVDPVKEAKAYEIMTGYAWRTHEEVTAELTGGDWEDNVRRRGIEQTKLTAAGLAVPLPSGDEGAEPEADPDAPDHDQETLAP